MRRQAAQPSIQEFHIPAPTGGLNTAAAGTAVPEGDCIQLFNMVSGEHGLRARLGYKLLAASGSFRTMHSFIGADPSGTQDRLFGISANNITRVSDDGSTSPDLFFTNSTLQLE